MVSSRAGRGIPRRTTSRRHRRDAAKALSLTAKAEDGQAPAGTEITGGAEYELAQAMSLVVERTTIAGAMNSETLSSASPWGTGFPASRHLTDPKTASVRRCNPPRLGGFVVCSRSSPGHFEGAFPISGTNATSVPQRIG